MEKITKEYEEKFLSLIRSVKEGNDSAIDALFDLEKQHILMQVNKYGRFWPDTDEILEMVKSQLSFIAKKCDIDEINVAKFRWSIDSYLRDFLLSDRHLMTRSTERGRTIIEDSNFELLYNHINELSFNAQLGRRLYDALIKIWETEDASGQLISIILKCVDREEAIEQLSQKFNVTEMVSTYILDLPLEELSSITLEYLINKQSFYSKAEDCICALEDMHNKLEDYNN